VDDLGQLVLTSDEAVAHAIRTVFQKFAELGSARQVFLWWRDQKLKFPVRRLELRSHPVVWVEPVYRMILQMLHHPVYAGAYVFGRSQTLREFDTEDPPRLRVRRIRRKEWPVLIRDHHPAYIAFEQFLVTQQRVQENAAMMEGDTTSPAGPVREGRALLQGLGRCGICGRRMYVSYGGHRSRQGAARTMQYRCMRARQAGGGPDCQTIGGRRIDHAVVHAFLEVTAPAGVEATRVADEELRHEHEALAGYWRLQIEQAEYAAHRAERQFHAVEPEHRVVARELERRWNDRLSELDAVRSQAQAAQRARPGLTEPERVRAQTLGRDLSTVWNAATTTNRDRKRLLRCVIEEAQLTTEPSRYLVRIVWKGGAITDREVTRHPRGGTGYVTAVDTVDLVCRLAVEFDDAQIARILNKQGRRSGRGNTFTKARVTSLRGHYGIAACQQTQARDPREGPFTADEAAAELGVAMHTIHRWLREGILAGEQATPGAPWRIVLTEVIRQRLAGGEAPTGWVRLTDAARRLGLSKSHVAYLVKAGKLPAVHATVGKRRCWRINISSATCGRQPALFDQMANTNPEESWRTPLSGRHACQLEARGTSDHPAGRSAHTLGNHYQ
jgi:Recombinase/Recombinase zinc beta ribbon domain/Helix-turn-helix domain